MAEYTTFIFPTDKSYRPTDEAIERASAYLDNIYLGHYTPTAERHEKVTLLDSGASFDRFTCPECGAITKMHDSSGLWYTCNWRGLCDEDQLLTVPCCNRSIPFKALGVSNLTAFVSFHFEVEGAGEDYLPSQEQLSQIGAILGCNVRHLISVYD